MFPLRRLHDLDDQQLDRATARAMRVTSTGARMTMVGISFGCYLVATICALTGAGPLIVLAWGAASLVLPTATYLTQRRATRLVRERNRRVQERLEGARHPHEVTERLLADATDYLMLRAAAQALFAGDDLGADPGDVALELLVEVTAARRGLEPVARLLTVLDPASPERLLADVLVHGFGQIYAALEQADPHVVEATPDMDHISALTYAVSCASEQRAADRSGA